MIGDIAARAVRFGILVGIAGACVGSANSNSQSPPMAPLRAGEAVPEPEPMDSTLAYGLWKSDFGAVKIEPNSNADETGLMGVWVYEREGAEVVGYFSGTLNGNVLEFSWREPGPAGGQLQGAGFLAFNPAGNSFSGQWWTHGRSRKGTWRGWRPPDGQAAEAIDSKAIDLGGLVEKLDTESGPPAPAEQPPASGPAAPADPDRRRPGDRF